MSTSLQRAGRVGLVAIVALVAAIAYSIDTFVPEDQPYRSATPLAITGFNLTGGKQTAFQTWFDPRSTVWRGEVSAFAVDAAGKVNIADDLWKASEKLAAQNIDAALSVDPGNCGAGAWKSDARRIVTRNGSSNVAFRWANLSATQQTSLDPDSTIQQNIVNFVRGDPTNEKQITELSGDGVPGPVLNPCSSATGTFRGRYSVLGDIINGKPIYIGAPAADYSFDGYPAYRKANAGRAGRLYVGANDGMLHAFDATSDVTTQGSEVFAYIPSMVIPNLNKLKASPYIHTSFVDGGLAAGDANFGTSGSPSWRTVLVGGLGAGGKGLYALDVTSPAAANEDAAKAKILWEIAASGDFADLGHTYGEAAIVLLNTGKWAAIVGNGYNAGKQSVLYVIDITDGGLIKSIPVGTASNGGLSSPRVIDTNSDGKADFVYAGDIDGKLWKFDISKTDPLTWTGAEFFDAGSTGSTPRSIMGIPDVVSHPLGGLMVHFGTGTLFTQAHAQSKTLQNYAYGIWDGAPAANTVILEQTLTTTVFSTTPVRVSSGLAINYDDTTKTLHKGWRTALPLGEHIVTSGFVRDSRFHFTSYFPPKDGDTSTSPATAAIPGESWIMQLDFLNGSTNGSPIFDFDNNSVLNDSDRISDAKGFAVPGAAGVPIGIKLGGGLFSEPLLALVSRELSVTIFNQTILPSGTPPAGCTTDCGSGVSGGHFDYDVYHNATGGSFKHTHEYDDKYDVVGASFTNASDALYNLANTTVKDNRVVPVGGAGTPSKFFVLVSNGDLSPGITFTVANKVYKSFEYPNAAIVADIKANGAKSPYLYDSETVKTFKWLMPFDGLTTKSWGQTPNTPRPGLIPTATACVKGGTRTDSGEFGENNNGALTIWIIKFAAGVNYDLTAPTPVIELNVPGKPEKGYISKQNALGDSYHLKHYTVFWHADVGCYKAGYNATPAPDTTENKGGGTAPPGTEDPPAGSGGGTPPTALSTTTVTTLNKPGDSKDLSGTRTTTTKFSDGSTLIVTETLDKKGNPDPKKTTSETVKGTGPTSTPGTVTAGSPNLQTGLQQLNNVGKLGRVTWHELIRE